MFSSEEEAQAAEQERKLLFKLHQWAEMKNDGWVPDWNNMSEDKCYIIIDLEDNELRIDSTTWMSPLSKLPFFKTDAIARECIDLFGDEIKEVLC